MAKTLNAATDLFEVVEVDLWGPKFSLNQPTRVVENNMEKALEALMEQPDDASDEDTFAAICEVIDALLTPIPDEEGKKSAAKTVLKAKYKAQEIGIGHINQLMEALMEERASRPS
jgi:uncharacterized protein with von Willebrand factor type A (vWA) domain